MNTKNLVKKIFCCKRVLLAKTSDIAAKLQKTTIKLVYKQNKINKNDRTVVLYYTYSENLNIQLKVSQ